MTIAISQYHGATEQSYTEFEVTADGLRGAREYLATPMVNRHRRGVSPWQFDGSHADAGEAGAAGLGLRRDGRTPLRRTRTGGYRGRRFRTHPGDCDRGEDDEEAEGDTEGAGEAESPCEGQAREEEGGLTSSHHPPGDRSPGTTEADDMHTKPMSESEGEFRGEFRKVPGLKCRKCSTEAVFCRVWESTCGGYEDEKYKCRACGHVWWVEGPDA